jgi:nucleotide-binding universal stress UspA family protein
MLRYLDALPRDLDQRAYNRRGVSLASHRHSHRIEEKRMYKNVLVATDGSRLSDKAVAHAIALAGAVGATVTAFYAAPDYPMPAYADGIVYEPVSRKEYSKLAAQDAEKILGKVVAKAKAADVQCRTAFDIAATPWEAILSAAKKAKADVIVMASHGRRGLSAVLLGSETQKVLTHSKLPVLVVR